MSLLTWSAAKSNMGSIFTVSDNVRARGLCSPTVGGLISPGSVLTTVGVGVRLWTVVGSDDIVLLVLVSVTKPTPTPKLKGLRLCFVMKLVSSRHCFNKTLPVVVVLEVTLGDLTSKKSRGSILTS